MKPKITEKAHPFQLTRTSSAKTSPAMAMPTPSSSSSFFFFIQLMFLPLHLATAQVHVQSIFILSGQSNMAGRGGVVNRIWDGRVPPDCRPNPSIFRLNPNLQWEHAREPIHAGIDGDTCGIGPDMAFADDVIGHGLGTVGLVPCAVGGTRISEWARGRWLYERMVQRSRKAVEGGGTLRALLWFQGESDTIDLRDANSYGTRMEQLIRDVRSDLNAPNLPIIQVALATGQGPYIGKVRAAQLGLRLPNLVTVDGKGLQVGGDYVHLTTNGEVRLGHMLAAAYRAHF